MVIVSLVVLVGKLVVSKCKIGDECTNKNGIVGFCQYRSKCQRDTDLGAICNSKQTIICCAKNVLRNKHFVSSNNQKEDRSIQPPLGFNPDFFHAPVLQPNPTASINFFNYQKQNTPNFVGNVLHQSSNTMEFVEDRPYQNYEQGVVIKPNKNSPTNEYGFYSSNNKPNSNNENIMYVRDQTTNIPQNYYNYPNYETQRPVSQNQNNNFNQPYYETYPQIQNNNKYQSSVPQRPNYNQYDNQPHQETNESNQNNNPNYYTTTKKPQHIYSSGNNENNSSLPNSQINHSGYEENKRPSQNTNHKTSSSILFPDDLTDTKFTTTTKKYYEYENSPNEDNKRISEKKCEEYSKTLRTTVSVLPLSIGTASKPVSIEKCGSKSVGLIVGGTKADLGEFPHMVAVGYRAGSGTSWNCGGTLISEQFVLTAAHCTHSTLGFPERVRLGDLNLQTNNDGAHPVEFLVDETIVHPDYIKTSKYNDIALLRLDNEVKLNNHIRPACLYNNDNIDYSQKVTATGWGSIEYGERSSDHLLKVDLNLINNQQCGKLYEGESKTRTLNRGIIDSMLCAGDLAGGHDTCLGDSGGPLVVKSEKNACVFNLIGITSFGKLCATENSPGVYTKVSAFLPWIEQIVWP
ncbi:serine protease Hayan isoform X2 [Acyrthosiphon pisum]|uniref:Peptidase S1 domain-containing protein n=1 Tax=Acyrthosiphon pisum TaxID=7029 RepID=A0A8R2JNK1_ACYPI|nr:serine protease Hayan isoform X2 [Acyrthosiphon pisum]